MYWKIYFYDNGVINAVTGNFLPLHKRTDVGSLWENYIMSERRKYLQQKQLSPETFFWRTTQQQEIDYIEYQKNSYLAVEIKWNPKAKAKFSTTFLDAYKNKTQIVTPENMEDFLL